MSRKRVVTWPTYLLHGVPENLRCRLVEDARAADSSIGDVIRAILCDRYDLRCPPVSYHYMSSEFSRHGGDAPFLLRLQPKLHRALKAELAEPGHATLRGIMLDALEAHYAAVT